MRNKQEKLMIIDGNALVHRSFHALPPTMSTKDGRMVNAVYGFTSFLLKAIRELKPDYIALTFDRKAPTFRHEAYKEYKAHRVKAPDELYSQIPLVKQVAEALRIPIFEQDGLEADDLIGIISTTVDGAVEKIIVTGDMDTLQLVNDHVKVYTMSRGLSDSVLYDVQAVKGRYGLMPEQMVDYKALRGDPSDNIPGVKGIGEKTATELLKEFGTLEKLYGALDGKGADKIRPRILELLRTHKEDAFLSKRLATIRCEGRIGFELEKTRFGKFDANEVVSLFSEFEFKSLLPKIREISVNGASSKTERAQGAADKYERNAKLFRYELVSDEKHFRALLTKLKGRKMIVIDTETSSLDVMSTRLLGISFAWQAGEAFYVKMQAADRKSQTSLFDYKDAGGNGLNRGWLDALKPILENGKIGKCGHNIKFDVRVLKALGVEVRGVVFDSMVASYLLNPGSRQHNLDAIVFTELGFEKISKDDLLGRGRERIGFGDVPVEKLASYSCEDADFTFRLVGKLSAGLKANKLEKLFADIEMPLVPVLSEMEHTGVKLDVKFLAALSKSIHAKIGKLEKKIKKSAGMDFNINSTQQLAEVLFEKLEIPVLGVGKTKTGLSTAADQLEKLKGLHPIIPLIQEYRELAKLASTYVDALPDLVSEKTGRLHTCYNQTVTATGRLSSSDPNLQNIPIRTELGREIRKAFVADKGFKLLSLDYSQIELRLAAHMSSDQKMIKAFKAGEDIHSATAAAINGLALSKVTPEMRRAAKATNFGIIYGQGPHGLSQAADIPYWQAKEFIDQYFKVYKNIKKYVEDSIENARKNGYAETLFGRRRFLPEIDSSVMMVRKGAERMAVNTPLQGTAADMIKVAMIKVAASGMLDGAKMLLQVHDELLFEVREGEVEELAKKIRKIMEGVIKLKVPVIVDAKVGDNWGEMEKMK